MTARQASVSGLCQHLLSPTGVSMRTSQKTEHLTGEQGRQATLPSVKFGLSLEKRPSTF